MLFDNIDFKPNFNNISQDKINSIDTCFIEDISKDINFKLILGQRKILKIAVIEQI